MKYGIIGAGDVARAIGSKLEEQGHEVMYGSRKGGQPRCGTFREAAEFGEVVWCCVRGIHALEALQTVGAGALAGKILIDQTNPYLYQDGHIALDPRWSGTTSLGEEIQRLLPQTHVVKTLNYLHNYLMTHPAELPEPITGFYCGNDAEAKAFVAGVLRSFGWQDTLDLGGIAMSRYTEMLGTFWVAALNATGSMEWGFRLVR